MTRLPPDETQGASQILRRPVGLAGLAVEDDQGLGSRTLALDRTEAHHLRPALRPRFGGCHDRSRPARRGGRAPAASRADRAHDERSIGGRRKRLAIPVFAAAPGFSSPRVPRQTRDRHERSERALPGRSPLPPPGRMKSQRAEEPGNRQKSRGAASSAQARAQGSLNVLGLVQEERHDPQQVLQRAGSAGPLEKRLRQVVSFDRPPDGVGSLADISDHEPLGLAPRRRWRHSASISTQSPLGLSA